MGREPGLRERFERLLEDVRAACEAVYGARLVSLAVFGSVGRSTARPDSDIDLLLVAEPLPDGRMRRVEEFEEVERRLQGPLASARRAGVETRLSPVFKTPREVQKRSPLLLDLVDDARILVDREGLLQGTLQELRKRLAELGAQRIWRGNAWYWDLKPDYRRGEVFEL
jgi:predicted nucleotidyltransferase